MSERKPPGVDFESWVDRRIRLAAEAGAFDDLPGLGKPIPDHGSDENWWLRSYLDREGLSGEALLPESLQLRREAERLPGRVDDAATEAEVREIVGLYNRRVAEYLRFPEGPPVPVHTADPEELLARWRAARGR